MTPQQIASMRAANGGLARAFNPNLSIADTLRVLGNQSYRQVLSRVEGGVQPNLVNPPWGTMPNGPNYPITTPGAPTLPDPNANGGMMWWAKKNWLPILLGLGALGAVGSAILVGGVLIFTGKKKGRRR